MPLSWLNRLDLDEALSVRFLQFAHNLSNRSHYSSHRKRQAIEATLGVLMIPDMMHRRVSNGARFFHTGKLSAIICQESVVAATSRIRQEVSIFLPLPAEALGMINLVPEQQTTEWFE